MALYRLIARLYLFGLFIRFGSGHIAGGRAELSQLQKTCENAYTCFHDTIPVCGKSVQEMRTFLDVCDLYEFSCEYNVVFRHVKEEESCPEPGAYRNS